MNVNRVLEIRDGDTVGGLRQFLSDWWVHYELDALLAPVEHDGDPLVTMQIVQNQDSLARVNPFAPVMLANSAAATCQFVHDHPGKRLAAILRPCEMRAFVELRKRCRPPGGSATLTDPASERGGIVILGVDCLGTYSRQEYVNSVASRGKKEVTFEVLRNAAEGGLRPQRFRTACQVCDWPAPRGADVAIGAIGVVSDKCLLLIVADEDIDERLGLPAVAGKLATEYQVSRRETVVGAVADARAGVRRTLFEESGARRSILTEGGGTYRFNDLGSILAWFANCSLCGQCLEACPVYEGEFGGMLGLGRSPHTALSPLAALVEISHWLASCGGCGMCAEMCQQDVPLTLLISALSHRIRTEMGYTAGDPVQRLPWT